MKKRTLTAVLALIFALLLLPSTATAAITGNACFYDVPGHYVANLTIQFEPVTTPDGETVYIFEFELTTDDDGDGVPVPSRPGYIFLGWESETDGKIYNYGDTITLTAGSYNFYAVWANIPDIKPEQSDTPDEPDISYDDVSADAWYYDAVEYVSKNGIMNGMGESVFQPDATMNRAMIWTMLARLDGADPMGDVTREQLITMLYRYAQYKGLDVSVGEETNILSYTDVDQVSEWAISAFQWACGAGIIEGDDDASLSPQANTTRAEAAAILMRFIEG